MKLVRTEIVGAKNFIGGARRSAEVVEKVGEGRIGRVVGLSIRKGSQVKARRVLRRDLPQELDAIAEGVTAAQPGLRLLKQQVIRVAELK